MNSVVLIGRVSREIELKFIPSSGMAIAKISLAVDKDLFGEKKQQAITAGKPTADFISVTVFGKSAENCANYLTKGSQCAIHGRINTSSYNRQDGTKAYSTDVIADKVEFIGSKGKQEGTSVNLENELRDAFGDDIFQPIEDGEEIPF